VDSVEWPYWYQCENNGPYYYVVTFVVCEVTSESWLWVDHRKYPSTAYNVPYQTVAGDACRSLRIGILKAMQSYSRCNDYKERQPVRKNCIASNRKNYIRDLCMYLHSFVVSLRTLCFTDCISYDHEFQKESHWLHEFREYIPFTGHSRVTQCHRQKWINGSWPRG
jgi:hypothetical protein